MDERAVTLAEATCCAYDFQARIPCAEPATVQGVCRDHAVMCAMCGTGLSARGVCAACTVVLASERLAAPPPGRVEAPAATAEPAPRSLARPAHRSTDIDF